MFKFKRKRIYVFMVAVLVLMFLVVGCRDEEAGQQGFSMVDSDLGQHNLSQVPATVNKVVFDFNQEVSEADIAVEENETALEDIEVTTSGKTVELSNLNLADFKVYNLNLTAKNNDGKQVANQIQFVTEGKEEVENSNSTMMQTFYWNIDKQSLWETLDKRADELSNKGITSLWLPPANKASEQGSVGYKPYDFWDLGEFDQAGGVRTRYGTRDSLEDALTSIDQAGMKAYFDVVLNHRFAPGDENIEPVELESGKKIEAYTDMPNMKGREEYYSQDDQWDWDKEAFDGVDYDAKAGQEIDAEPFKGKEWDDTFAKDYLLAADVDYQNKNVVSEMNEWGTWITEDVGFDGFRMDAIKHVSSEFTDQWIDHVQENTEEDIFFVGEAWEVNDNKLIRYLEDVGNPDLKVFDFSLRGAFENLRDGSLDMRELKTRGLVNQADYHDQAVTFVDNHDTDREEGSYTRAISARTYQAYTYILMHEQGTPTIYWKDYYVEEMEEGLDKLLAARQKFAHGPGKVADSTDKDTFVYLREGKPDVKNSGLVELITKKDATGEVAEAVEYKFTYEPEGDPDSVSVAGGFNGWDKASTPLKDEDGDGVYETTELLPPGEYPYKFVTDGENWIEPPNEEEYVEDGYGGKNALAVVEKSQEDNGEEEKEMIVKEVNTTKANTAFVDYTGNVPGIIKTDDQGTAEFKVKASASQGWSVWVPVY
ncbi:MAG: alpha-amylase family glycosyl hydrolase [Bacillota bacterium]